MNILKGLIYLLAISLVSYIITIMFLSIIALTAYPQQDVKKTKQATEIKTPVKMKMEKNVKSDSIGTIGTDSTIILNPYIKTNIDIITDQQKRMDSLLNKKKK